MNAHGYIKLSITRNNFTYNLDIPHGATWNDCLDTTLDFIPLIKALRERELASHQKSEEITPEVQEAV
jgi:hypothetical protein